MEFQQHPSTCFVTLFYFSARQHMWIVCVRVLIVSRIAHPFLWHLKTKTVFQEHITTQRFLSKEFHVEVIQISMAIYRRSGGIVAQSAVCVMKKFYESQCRFHKNALDTRQTIVSCWDVQMKVIEQLIVSMKFHGSLRFFYNSMNNLWTPAVFFANPRTHAMFFFMKTS